MASHHQLAINASTATSSCSTATSINGKHYYSLRSSNAENDVAKCESQEESRDDADPKLNHDLGINNEESCSDGSSSAANHEINHSSTGEQVEVKSSSSKMDGDVKGADGHSPDPYSNADVNAGTDINPAPAPEIASAVPGKLRMRRKKFLGVRQRPSGRWVAEIKDTTQKIRMWLGTFDTAEEAARAYDEAACLLRGSNTRTNFLPSPSSSSPSSSPLASRLAHLLRTRRSQSSSAPGSPELPNISAATMQAPAMQPNPSSPGIVASSHINPLLPPPFRGSSQGLQGGRHFPNRFLSHPFSGPTAKQSLNSHFLHHKHQQSLQNFSHRKSLLNHGYSLQHLHSHDAEAQPRVVQSWISEARKPANDSPPSWRPYSKLESESSDSDPSSPQTDFLMKYMPRISHHFDDDCQVMTMSDSNAFHSSEHLAFDYMSLLSGQILSSTNLHESADQEMEMDDHSQIFARDKHLINAEDIDDLTHDQHSMKSSHYHHNYRGSGSFMNALLGFNDDIILDSSDHTKSIAPSFDHNKGLPFADFNVDSSLAGTSLMHVDDFPLISELSGKLELAESNHDYTNNRSNDASNHSSSSSSSNMGNNNGHDKDDKVGLHASANADLEMKRLQFERRASTSLYTLTGVHEMLMKQNSMSKSGVGSNNNVLAGNVTATSSFNFLSTSPSYIHSSPWKPLSGSSLSISNGDESTATDANVVSGALMIAQSSMPARSSSPSDNMRSDTTINGTTTSSISSNNSDAQSQQEAAMWNSWDLAPLCTLVA
ncbi:hypothetical protein GOP47_0024164 [Adiantum capillus-veneris]|uniref:AP2/ERF domain-containing protein n=1 Tax=Adiantum capillus-veneris TaxID=13818 RepID=A0A9D4Z546_ADICA|nr:hypothetical protein GOP47_0024164 [Adiantum capillus-veneris]